MGFKGIIVTDSMSMDAIDKHWGTGQAAIMAINAGADIVMATGSSKQQLETYHALYDALKTGKITEERINESLYRILKAKLKYNVFNHRNVIPANARKIVHSPAHKQAAAKIARKSITLLKNDGILPFTTKKNQATLVVGPKIYGSTKYINAISKAVDDKGPGRIITSITSINSTDAEIANALDLAKQAERVIAVTFSSRTLSPGQVKLITNLRGSGKPLVVLSLGLPYDIRHFPHIGAYIACYAIDRWGSPVPTSWNAAVNVIFGEKPAGKLPVSINHLYQYGDGLSK
jgi:beta-N-acetylhexosaminidase